MGERSTVAEAAAPAEQGSAPVGSTTVMLGLLFVVVACLGLLFVVPPGSIRTSERTLTRPFEADASSAAPVWFAAVDLPGWLQWNRRDPPVLTLYEDGKELGPVRLVNEHDPTAPNRIELRTSDTSDPNANGRTYRIHYQRSALPLIVWLGAVALAVTAAWMWVGMLVERITTGRPLVRGLLLILSSVVYAAALLESEFAVLVADRLAQTPNPVRVTYDHIFNQHLAKPESTPVQTPYFRSHPYLNFALNPDAGYKSQPPPQFNADYLIRRKEPIRPRGEVTWRALALGGSTTFGEGVPRERDTWVYRLEQKMRTARGPSIDVINGGVGGYTLIENFLHYILLLDDLAPDVVILYVGINDVHPRLTGHLKRDYSNSRIPWRSDPFTLPSANPVLSPFAPYRYVMLRDLEEKRYDNPNILGLVQLPYSQEVEWDASLRANGPAVYATHLRNLVRLIRAQGRQVVIVPQVFIPRSRSDETFSIGVVEHNQINAAVAREFGVPFLAHVADAFDQRDLGDNCHFNLRGQAKMAGLLSDYFQATPSSVEALGEPR